MQKVKLFPNSTRARGTILNSHLSPGKADHRVNFSALGLPIGCPIKTTRVSVIIRERDDL